jgi:hypothetical protein
MCALETQEIPISHMYFYYSRIFNLLQLNTSTLSNVKTSWLALIPQLNMFQSMLMATFRLPKLNNSYTRNLE